MPSPISRTRPTSWTAIRSLNWLISSVRTETISSALNLMAALFQNLVPKIVDARLDRAVVLEGAHADLHAAEQARIDRRDHHGLLGRFRLENRPQVRELIFAERR